MVRQIHVNCLLLAWLISVAGVQRNRAGLKKNNEI